MNLEIRPPDGAMIFEIHRTKKLCYRADYITDADLQPIDDLNLIEVYVPDDDLWPECDCLHMEFHSHERYEVHRQATRHEHLAAVSGLGKNVCIHGCDLDTQNADAVASFLTEHVRPTLLMLDIYFPAYKRPCQCHLTTELPTRERARPYG